jgi:DNA-directed RNA polymerase specialized sigma24 family protein
LNDALKRLHVGIIAGDQAAQVAFEAAVRPYALGIATRRGLPLEDAEEIWNDAFRLGLERASTIMPPGRLRAFVLCVTHAASVDRLRLRVRSNEVEFGGAEPEIDAMSATQRASATSLSEAVVDALRRCLQTASALHCDVITMAANSLTAREIASALAMTDANAAKIRQRARAWFALCLEGVVP